MTIAGICSRHGYWQGSACERCFSEKHDKAFYASKDKLWEFVDIHTTGKPVEIRSKGQWKRHIKSLGLHDDIKQSSRKHSELGSEYNSKVKFDREEIKNHIRQEMKERNIYDQKKLFIESPRGNLMNYLRGKR